MTIKAYRAGSPPMMMHRYAANVAERHSIEEAMRLGLGDRL